MVRSIDEVHKHGRMLKAKFQIYFSKSKFLEIKTERLELKALVKK